MQVIPWPDPLLPGYPIAPDKAMAHHVVWFGASHHWLWLAGQQHWLTHEGTWMSPLQLGMAKHVEYHGPLYSGAEMQAAYDAGFADSGEGHNGDYPDGLALTDNYAKLRGETLAGLLRR